MKIKPVPSMECPKCMGELREKTIGDKQTKVTVDQCFACQGIWFDQGELRQVLKRKIHFKDKKEAEVFEGERRDVIFDLKTARCPVCRPQPSLKYFMGGWDQSRLPINVSWLFNDSRGRETMKRVKLTEGNLLVVDHCASCDGIWLDGGEIRLLMRGRPLGRAFDFLLFQVKDFLQKRPLSKSFLKRSKI